MTTFVARVIEHQYDLFMAVSTDDDQVSQTCDEATLEPAAESLVVLAGHLNAVNAQLVAATADLVRTGAWQQGGKRTPSAFLQWKLGLSPARADEVVRVAERRDDFPVLMAGFDRGELSIEQMAAAVAAPAWPTPRSTTS